jgi:hypothetical protein
MRIVVVLPLFGPRKPKIAALTRIERLSTTARPP